MDSVLDRVESARLLMKHDRYFDAFLLGLIAFAGVSRRRYPKNTGYSAYFNRKRAKHPAQKARIDAAERQRAANARSDRRGKCKYLSDREAFQCLVFDEIGKITGPNLEHPPEVNVGFPFGPDLAEMNFEDILYEYFRCTSVHEGRFPATVVLTDPKMYHRDGEWHLGNELRLQLPNGWPKGWVENLINLIPRCPEVAADSQGQTC
jgi:hypothetical protein